MSEFLKGLLVAFGLGLLVLEGFVFGGVHVPA